MNDKLQEAHDKYIELGIIKPDKPTTKILQFWGITIGLQYGVSSSGTWVNMDSGATVVESYFAINRLHHLIDGEVTKATQFIVGPVLLSIAI